MPQVLTLPANFALRALPEKGSNIVGGLLIAFTSSHRRDKFRQYFTRSTNFGLDLLGDGARRPLNYHHNRTNIRGAIGFVRSIEITDEGLYAESELDETNPAYPFVMDAVDKGLIGYSAETLPNWMEVDADGQVVAFPVFGAALTAAPSAPERMTQVAVLRGLGLDVGGEDADSVVMTARSVWDIPPDEPAPVPVPVPAPVPAPAPVPIRQINYAEAQALRGGVGVRLPAPASGGSSVPVPSRIDVGSPLDDVPLKQILSWYIFARSATAGKAKDIAYPLTRDQFMRGLMTRVVQEFQQSNNGFLRSMSLLSGKDIIHTPSDWDYLGERFKKWTGRDMSKPDYLRADELMGSDVVGAGDEWVYDAWSAMVWRDIRQAAKIFGLFPQFNMPSNPFNYPTISRAPYARRVLEADHQSQMVISATTYKPRKPTTDNVVFAVPGKFGDMIFWSDELRRWSQIDLVAELQAQIIDCLTRTADRVLLRGDENDTDENISFWNSTSGTTPTSGTGENDYLLNLNGLAYHTLVTDTAMSIDKANAAFDIDFITQGRALMGPLGLDPNQLVLLTDAEKTPYEIMESSEIKTVDTFGAGASILTGEIGRVFGVPIVPSEEYPLTNGAGHIHQTAGNNTQLGFTIVHRGAVMIGKAFELEVTSENIPHSDSSYIKGRLAFDMQVMQSNGVAQVYDIAP